MARTGHFVVFPSQKVPSRKREGRKRIPVPNPAPTTGAFDKIRWTPLPPPPARRQSPHAFLQPAAQTTPLPAEHPTIAFLRTTDLPLPPEPPDSRELTAKEWAVFLLQAAAEVEHQFIVQYLYAGYCGNPASPVFEANSFNLIGIATEEMGHLLTVQNLLLMLNVPPYLNRLTASFADVEPFPLSLEPFSLTFVTRFLVAESPANPNPALPATVAADLKEGLTLKNIHRVGAIYAMLDWLLETTTEREAGGSSPENDPHLKLQLNSGDFIDPERFRERLNSATPWFAFGSIHVLPEPTETLNTREDLRVAARAAIHDVSAQGEGPAGGGPDSHYERLLLLYTALKADTSGIVPQGDFVTDPKTEGEPATTAVLITDPATRALAQKSDAFYQILLTIIALSVATTDTAFREATADAAVNTIMRAFLRVSAREVVGKPLLSGAGLPLAGPPFTPPAPFPFRPDALPGDAATERALCERLLAEIARLQADFGSDLSDLKTLTEGRLAAMGV